jgi:hypothetical protein
VATDSQILVTPFETSAGAGFSISASDGDNLFAISSTSGTASVTYYFDYFAFSTGIAGASLSLDPPYGDVTINQFFCNGFLSGGCLGSSIGQQTASSGSPSSTFSVSDSFGTETEITLTATPGNPAGFDSLTTFVVVPEPSTGALAGAVLVLVAMAMFAARRS